jgi:hypothetical protein
MTGAIGRAAGENVGSYAYTLGTLSAGSNYSLSIAVAPQFSITSKAIVVTANAGQTKVFGDTDPTPFTYTFAPALVGSDVMTGAIGRVAGENVGSYAYTLGTLSAGSNYSLSIAVAPQFSITSKAIMVTANAAQTKVFGDTDPTPFTYTFAPALVGSDVMTGAIGRAAGENVGSFAYTLGTLSAGSNYSLSIAVAPQFSITARNIVITGDPGQSKVYGSADPAIYTYTFAPALVGSDIITGQLARNAGENAAYYAYSQGTLSASTNYTLSVSAASSFLIVPKSLTIQAEDRSKCYDGAVYNGVYTATYNGFVTGEDPSVLSGTLLFGGPAVAAISAGNYAIVPSGLVSSNYSILYLNGNLLIQVSPAPIITGPGELCAGSENVEYTTEPGYSNYVWTISYGGIITTGLNTNEVTVNWATAGSRTISVNYDNSSGCSASVSSSYPVTVLSVPVPIISGLSNLCQGTSGVSYTSQYNNTNYQWEVSAGGTITSGAGTNSITVNWTGSGNQMLSLEYTNLLGCAPLSPSVFHVMLTPQPATPVIIQNGDTLTSSASEGNQWYLDGFIIPGATAQQHIAVYTGNYTVVVTIGDCSSGVSNSILVLPVSISDFEVSHEFEVYPNPNHGHFNIKVTSSKPVELNIEIFNNVGALLWKQEKVTIDGTYICPVDLDNVSNGVYLVSVRNSKTNLVKRVVIIK